MNDGTSVGSLSENSGGTGVNFSLDRSQGYEGGEESACSLLDPGTGLSSTSEVDSDSVQDTTDSIVDHSSHEENEELSLSPVPTPQRENPPTPEGLCVIGSHLHG